MNIRNLALTALATAAAFTAIAQGNDPPKCNYDQGGPYKQPDGHNDTCQTLPMAADTWTPDGSCHYYTCNSSVPCGSQQWTQYRHDQYVYTILNTTYNPPRPMYGYLTPTLNPTGFCCMCTN